MYAWNKQTCKCSQIFFVLNQGCDTDKAVICSNASRDDARSGYIVHVISSSTYKNLLTWLQKGVDQILKCHSDRTLRQNKLNILFDTTKIKEMFIWDMRCDDIYEVCEIWGMWDIRCVRYEVCEIWGVLALLTRPVACFFKIILWFQIPNKTNLA